MERTIGDYDPKTCTYFEYDVDVYTEAFRSEFIPQNENLDRDFRAALPTWVINALDAPIMGGVDKNHEINVRRGDGVGLIGGLLALYVPSSAVHQETLIDILTAAHEHMVGGNPKAKIEKILRPALNEIKNLQVSVKAINTIQPMIRTLVKRDDQFKEIRDKECFKSEKLVVNNNCADLLGQFFTDVCVACDEIEADNKPMKSSEVWKNNRSDEGNRRSVSANHGDVCEEEESKWFYDANYGTWVPYKHGRRGSKGGKGKKGYNQGSSSTKSSKNGGKSGVKGSSKGMKGKGGYKTSDTPWVPGKERQVPCANKGCW